MISPLAMNDPAVVDTPRFTEVIAGVGAQYPTGEIRVRMAFGVKRTRRPKSDRSH